MPEYDGAEGHNYFLWGNFKCMAKLGYWAICNIYGAAKTFSLYAKTLPFIWQGIRIYGISLFFFLLLRCWLFLCVIHVNFGYYKVYVVSFLEDFELQRRNKTLSIVLKKGYRMASLNLKVLAKFGLCSNRGFARQPCCMAGTKDSFSHGKRSSFICKIFSLFLPCNMAAVQNLYFSTTSMLCDRYSGFPPLYRKANRVLQGGVPLPFIGSLRV